MKKFISLMLSICIIFGCIHIAPTEVSAADSLSDSQITAIVENYLSIVGSNRYWNANIRSNQSLLKSQVNNGDYLSATTTVGCKANPKHSHDKYGNDGCTSNVFTGVSRGTAQCWGFGDYIEYVIFKTTDGSNWTKRYSVDSSFNFRPGDLIWSQKGSSSQHIRVVYKVVGSTVYVIEGNSDGHCKITSKILSDPHSYVNYSSSSYVMSPPSSLRNDSSTPPDTAPPTSVGMTCNYENMTINPGTQIQLDFWYSNGDSFDIIIDKDGSEYQRFNNVTSPFYYTPTERGNYIARGYAKNSVGSTESNRRAFYVKYVNAPTSVGMICNCENMTVKPGTQIQLDFWYSNGDSFDIVIDRNGVEYQRFNNVGSPFYYTPTEEGNYLARGYAKNEAGATESNRRAFYVSYSEPPTNVGMVCNYENMSVKPGTAIEFSYWYHNGNSFDVIIYRNNVEYERFSNVSNPFYYVPSEEGNYLAVGYAKNSAGATESNRRAFNVLSYVPPIPNGTYSILSSLDNSYALNVYARDPGDNNTLIIWQDPSQKFDVTYIGGGLYKIISSVTGKALCARDSGMSSGTDLVQYTWNGSLSQKWRIETTSDGYFYIVNCLNGLYIDVENSNASNGTNVCLYDGNSSYAQKWLFSPLTYTISYNTNGGENAPSAQTKNHRENLILSNITPSKTGYDFLGWSENPNAQSASYNKGATFTGNYNATLYAVWKPKQYYLDVNGLLDNVSASNTEGYGTFDLYVNGTLVADDVCDSYYLCNYGDSYQISDVKNSVGRSYNGSSSSLVGTITYTTTIELQFNSNQYTVNFNASGGNLTDLSKNVTYNSQYGELPIPIRKGYSFKGWYTASSGGNEITNTTMVTNISNHTLYAQWEKLIPDTNSTVTKKGTTYLISVIPIDIDDSCEIIIVGYKGNKFVTLTSIPYESEAINTTLSGNIDEIKVMVWNSLSGLKPLCEAEVIPSSEFIIE